MTGAEYLDRVSRMLKIYASIPDATLRRQIVWILLQEHSRALSEALVEHRKLEKLRRQQAKWRAQVRENKARKGKLNKVEGGACSVIVFHQPN